MSMWLQDGQFKPTNRHHVAESVCAVHNIIEDMMCAPMTQAALRM